MSNQRALRAGACTLHPLRWVSRTRIPRGRPCRRPERTLSCRVVAWRWGAHPVHGVGARGRRSERTPGWSPPLSMIPPRYSSEPERLVGASRQTRWGQGMAGVIGIDVSKLRLDVYRLEDGRCLAVGQRCRRDRCARRPVRPERKGSAGHGGLGRLRAQGAASLERAWPQGRDRERRAGARLCPGERSPGQNRPGRCRGDRALWRVLPGRRDPAGDRRAPGARRAPGLPPPALGRDHRAASSSVIS
jgi:hypothetical protein